MVDRAAILQQVNTYYSEKIATHGPVPAGVDWNSHSSQNLRFEQLLRLPTLGSGFSINDYGCGYGALYGYLKLHNRRCDYAGYDISEQMINSARRSYGEAQGCQFVVGSEMDRSADYTVASGLFNVRGSITDQEWSEYILETLRALNDASRKGFAFNCLTSYSDPEYMRRDLYYANPCALFDHCKKHFSRNVALLHDYELYEFTILVRK